MRPWNLAIVPEERQQLPRDPAPSPPHALWLGFHAGSPEPAGATDALSESFGSGPDVAHEQTDVEEKRGMGVGQEQARTLGLTPSRGPQRRLSDR